MADNSDRGAVGRGAGRLLGSLRDALAAATREEDASMLVRAGQAAAADDRTSAEAASPPPLPQVETLVAKTSSEEAPQAMADKPKPPSAADAAREARAGSPPAPAADRHVEIDQPPTTRVVKAGPATQAADPAPARTTLVRGRQQPARGTFHQDPVVGWLVIVGGNGLGAFRPIFEGNNTLGRSASQRIPLDFGDDAISSEEQAYVRYDSTDRSFLFVPNLAKTNVVSVNDKRPTGAVPLNAMDVITVGRTQLVFVPFCGTEFDWSELTESKKT